MADARHELLTAFLLALCFLHRPLETQRHIVELVADRRKFIVAFILDAIIEIARADLLHPFRKNIQRRLNLAKDKPRQKMVRENERNQNRCQQNHRHHRQQHLEKIA